MKIQTLAACAGLAIATAATAQVQEYIMGIDSATGGGVLLFNPQDGSLVNPGFIPDAGPGYSMSTPKGIIQVGSELWLADQVADAVFRFDLNGRYYRRITGDLNNIRGLGLHDGHVYVTNATAAGSSPGNSLVKYDLDGNYVTSFVVGSSPFDALSVGNEILVTHSSGTNDITRWDASGNSLGVFHSGAISFAQQITRLSNGNFLVAGFSPPSGIYEYDANGVQLAVYPTSSSGPRGVVELGNGNFMWTDGSGFHIYDRVAGISTLATAGTGQYLGKVSIDLSAVGACCLNDFTCQVMSITDCGAQGGVFRGDGVTCANANCVMPAACCFPDGTCSMLTEDQCANAGGAFHPGTSSCAAVTCPTFLPTPLGTAGVTTAGAGIFFDLVASTNLSIERIEYYPGTASGNPTSMELYVIPGTYVGNDASSAGWVLAGSLASTSQGTAVSLPVTLSTPIELTSGQSVGVYLVTSAGGLRYRASSSPNPVSDSNLTLTSDLFRSAPWGGTATVGRRFAGIVWYDLGSTPPTCYANCDGSTQPPILNVADFGCFLGKFAAGDLYANCDGSTQPPVLNVADFGCFLGKFAAGCP